MINIKNKLKNSLNTEHVKAYFYKPGEKKIKGLVEEVWNDCISNDVICLGWNDWLYDFFHQNRPNINSLAKIINTYKHRKNPARAINIIKHFFEIKYKDLIFACKGNLKIIGIGLVLKGKIKYDDSLKLKTIRKIEWIYNFYDNPIEVKDIKLSKNIAQDTVSECKISDAQKIISFVFNNLNLSSDLQSNKYVAQGLNIDPILRKKIENFAVDKACIYLKRNKFNKIDTTCSKNNPYDIICFRKKEKYFIEVKGTTSIGNEIILTKNEVKFNKKNKNHLLIVVGNIKVKNNNIVKNNFQINTYNPFTINKRNLHPISYYYALKNG